MSCTTGVATFDYPTWCLRFPQLAGTPKTLATVLWNEATLFLNNGVGSLVTDVGQRGVLLNLLTAHLAQLQQQSAGGNGMVGRISSAAEGAVSVTAEMPASTSAQQAWLMQTQYGAELWAATAQYRQMRYVPGPCAPYGYWPLYGGRW